jgi:hypothetical protein
MNVTLGPLMPGHRETILAALADLLRTIPFVPVLRGEVLPERIPAAGLPILRDGESGVTLSPLRYHYQQRAELEVVFRPQVSAICASIAGCPDRSALAADRTLMGLCDWVEAESPAAGGSARRGRGQPERRRDRGDPALLHGRSVGLTDLIARSRGQAGIGSGSACRTAS